VDEARKATLIPLARSERTPELFGEPLAIGINLRDAWLLVVPMELVMPTSRPVSVVLVYPCTMCCHRELLDKVQKADPSCRNESPGIGPG
jgi:hypothetical protein